MPHSRAQSTIDPPNVGRGLSPAPPPLSPIDRWVVEVHHNLLRTYDLENGLTFTDALTEARLFTNFQSAHDSARMFGGMVHRVLVNYSGRNPRLALLHNHREDAW